METEADEQYVTDVSRGYALYLANCARCHGDERRGRRRPAAQRPDEAVQRADADRACPAPATSTRTTSRHVLEVGGRYVCGDPNSVMPAWREPAGPLNYREVEELIAFLAASTDTTFTYVPPYRGRRRGPTPAAGRGPGLARSELHAGARRDARARLLARSRAAHRGLERGRRRHRRRHRRHARHRRRAAGHRARPDGPAADHRSRGRQGGGRSRSSPGRRSPSR